MIIDLKKIQELLYLCNANFYDFTIDTENMDIVIELNEDMENVDMEVLEKGLVNMLGEGVVFEVNMIYISLLDYEDIGMI